MDIVAAITTGSEDIPAVFFFDDAQNSWHIIFPQDRDSERLTVETSANDLLWSWGVVDLNEVDVLQYVVPALEDYVGSETMLAIEAELERLRAEAERLANEQAWALDCVGLGLVDAFFLATRDSAYDGIDSWQMSLGCGECNPFSEQFQQEWEEFITAKMGVSGGVDIVGGVVGAAGGPLVELAMVGLTSLLSDVASDALIDQLGLHCDFECFLEGRDAAYWVLMAVYYVSDTIHQAVELVETSYMTPPCP